MMIGDVVLIMAAVAVALILRYWPKGGLLLLAAITSFFVTDAILDPTRWGYSGNGLLAAMCVFALMMAAAALQRLK